MPSLIPPHDWLSYGFRDRVVQKQNKSEQTHIPLLDMYRDIDKRQYGYVFPECRDVYESTARYQVPVPILTKDYEEEFLEGMMMEFPELLKGTRVLDFDELTLNVKAAVGPLADAVYRNTKDYLRFNGAQLQRVWDNAVFNNWPIFMKTSGKVEMLPIGKVPRTFIFMDRAASLCGSRVVTDFNDKIKLMRGYTMSAIGMSIYGAEFQDIAGRLNSFPIKLIADVSRWDANFTQRAFHAIRRFRRKCMRDKYGRRWIDHLYNEICSPLVFMPSGELIQLDHGNPSGQPSTSTDNTLYHAALIWKALWRTAAKCGVPRSQIRRHFYSKVYGDDLVMGLSALFGSEFPDILKELYIEVGLVVKPDAFKVSTRLEDMTFLGGRFKRCAKHGAWTYVPSKEKLLESLCVSDKDLSNEDLLQKAFSLYLLGYHTKYRSKLHDAYLLCRRLVPDPPEYWTPREVESFVHGHEGSHPQMSVPWFSIAA